MRFARSDLFPYLPLPHLNHPVGGMVFPQMQIKALPRLERFDLDFDLPEHFLPEFPPAIFLTTRPDLGDVFQGPTRHDRELLRALQGHPQPEATRRPAPAGHAVPAAAVQRHRRPQDRATRRHAGRHLLRLPRQRPHQRRRRIWSATSARRSIGDRIDTPSLRGVNIQRLFGSQRALQDGRGLHRVRAARRLLRRRSGARDQEGRQPARSRQPGPPHGGVPEAARLPAGAEAGPRRQARSDARPAEAGAARPGAVLRQGASARRATRRRTTPTT